MADEYIRKRDAVDAMLKTVIKAYSIEYGVQNFIDSDDACKVLNDLPAADVAPVVHSEWIYHMSYGVCKKCGYEYEWKGTDAKNYCPNCGAKMDAEGEE